MAKQAMFGENSKHDLWLTVWVAINKANGIKMVTKGVKVKKEALKAGKRCWQQGNAKSDSALCLRLQPCPTASIKHGGIYGFGLKREV